MNKINNQKIHRSTLGIKYLREDNYLKGIEFYEREIENNPEEIENYWYLGIAYFLNHQEEEMEQVWGFVLLSCDNYQDSIKNLLSILSLQATDKLSLKKWYLAVRIYHKIQELLSSLESMDLQYANDYYNLGVAWENLADQNQAIEAYYQAISINPQFLDAYLALGNIHRLRNDNEQAELVYRQAIKYNPSHFLLYYQLYLMYDKSGDTEKAINFAEEVGRIFPNTIFWQCGKYLTLPIVYRNEEEINQYYQKYSQGIDQIIESLNLNNEGLKKDALASMALFSNFEVGYDGLNVLERQKKYGKLLYTVTTANFDFNSEPLNLKPLENRKIKVGYISSHLFDHTIAKLFRGWLKNHDRTLLEIYCYHTGLKVTGMTQEIKSYSDKFVQIRCSKTEEVAQAIREDELDILVFLDIGMETNMYPIAGLRLAPIQCMTWGHPITSGLPTIDYFLSCKLMEVEDAQQHYTEKLVLLPNIGISYTPSQPPEIILDRDFFGIDSESIIYLCCQSTFKYLPQYDYIFPSIARKVVNAKFVFIGSQYNDFVTAIFKERLSNKFAEYDLNMKDFCVFLPRLNGGEYLSLNLISDVYLDTFAWSGGHTTLEALACNLPVVTCPSEFMRGRHSYGILKMLGVEETLANSEQEYIHIAVRLGVDKKLREEIKEKIKANHHNLYEDLECVKGLEKFYQDVVKDNLG